MTEKKKRIPPWERARIIFRMQEEERKRKLLGGEMKQRQGQAKVRARRRPGPFDELEANRKRLAAMKKRMEEEAKKDT